MADLSYQVSVDTQQAQQSLQRLQQSIRTVNDTFTSLNRTIAGLAVGAFTANAIRMAAALDDVASASGMALSNVVGFSQAVAANGGNIEGAANAIGRFSNFIDAAAKGNKEAQSTLLQLGVGMNDLRTLSEQDLLRKTIAGLGSMDAGARRTAASIDIFGKSFASVDIAAVNAQMDGFIQRAGPTASALRSAAQAEENFGNALFTVQTQLLAALKPISDLAASITANAEAIGKWIEVIIEVGKVVATFFLVTKAIQLVVAAARALAAAPVLIAEGWAIIKKTFELIAYQFGKVKDAGEVTIKTMEGLSKRFKFLGDGLALAAKGFGVLAAAAVAAWQALKGLFGGSEQAAENESATWDKIMENRARDIEARKKQEAEIRRVTSAVEQETQALTKQVGAYQNNIAASNKKYQTETELVNASERRKLLVEELNQAEQAYLTTVAALLDDYAKKSQSSNEVDLQMLPRISQAIQDVTTAYQAQIGAITANTEARAKANEERALETYRTRAQIDYENQLQRIMDDMAKSSMSEIERKYYDIEAAARASAKAAIEAEEARRGSPMGEQERKAYEDAALRGTQRLKDETARLYEQSRTFSAGWRKAFREYADNANNAAKRAEDLFRKATQGMEDAIVNFAKTGKFEWKNFVNMMLEELLRANIQGLFAQIFGAARPGGGGGGGGGGSIIDVLGGALGGIFGSSGKGGSVATPPTQSSGGGFFDTLGKIGGGIFDAAKSIGGSILGGISDLFGGGFANGGMLPAGKFGLVGERGPELISGPATITPFAGATNITYNIQAVDAASFQSLVARDPGFIYAVTEQGRKSITGTRR